MWAAIAVLAALQFVYQGKRAQIDPTLVLFTTLSLYGLCRHLLLGPQWRWFWLGCFAAGLGVILKGVGFLPLLALLPFAAMRRRRWTGEVAAERGAGWRWALAALAFLAAIALWFVPMLVAALAEGDPAHRAYLDNILFKQTATRYAEAWHHHQPAWYFLGVIAVFWLPFSLALPWLARPWLAAWRARDARVWLPLAWGLLVLVFFSSSPGKRDMYILGAAGIRPRGRAVRRRHLGAARFRYALGRSSRCFGACAAGIGATALSGGRRRCRCVRRGARPRRQRHRAVWLLAGLGVLAIGGALAFPRRARGDAT